MTSTSSWGVRSGRALLAAAFLVCCWAQSSGPLNVSKPVPIRVRQGETVPATLKVQLAQGYHVNTNKPADEYLIPLRLTWEANPLEVIGVTYPPGRTEKYQFSDKPLSVYTGDFDLITKFKAPPTARKGTHKLAGKLRYQACTETTCFPPKTVAVELQADIR